MNEFIRNSLFYMRHPLEFWSFRFIKWQKCQTKNIFNNIAKILKITIIQFDLQLKL